VDIVNFSILPDRQCHESNVHIDMNMNMNMSLKTSSEISTETSLHHEKVLVQHLPVRFTRVLHMQSR
jgi:hypothetical protein